MKRMTDRAAFFFFLIGWTGLILMRCDIDHGLRPIHSRIGGVIQFSGDRVPLDTDEIRVAVVKDFPPKSIQELLFSDMIPFRGPDTSVVQTPVPWEIFVPPGQYGMVAVIWKENNESWNISDVVGVYGGFFLGDVLFPTYKSVAVPSYDSEIDTIDIQANLNRVNRDAKISGTITFRGPWPANTGMIGVGAFLEIPQQGNVIDYYLKNAALAYGLPAFVDRTEYRLRVRSKDELKYVAVIWINSSFDLTSIRDVGFYADPNDPEQPKGLKVPYGQEASGIDITVDFSKL